MAEREVVVDVVGRRGKRRRGAVLAAVDVVHERDQRGGVTPLRWRCGRPGETTRTRRSTLPRRRCWCRPGERSARRNRMSTLLVGVGVVGERYQ